MTDSLRPPNADASNSPFSSTELPRPPRRTRVKICGVCRVQDAVLAAAAGADAIGLVCHPKAGRYVPPVLARQIISAVPAFVTPVALFVNQPRQEIDAFLADAPSAWVQLHGQETPEFVSALRVSVIKAVHADPASFAATLRLWREACAGGALPMLKGLVLETAGSAGGTGRANDWSFLRRAADEGLFEGLPPVIAAGGLTPDTVGPVIRALRPWAVDVSSGVEQVRREKDAAMIHAFIAAARQADADL